MTTPNDNSQADQPLGLPLNDVLGAGAEARKAWEPIGWGTWAYNRAGTIHLWLQSPMRRSGAYAACGRSAKVDQRDLQPPGDGLAVCQRCLKSAPAKAAGAPEAPNVPITGRL